MPWRIPRTACGSIHMVTRWPSAPGRCSPPTCRSAAASSPVSCWGSSSVESPVDRGHHCSSRMHAVSFLQDLAVVMIVAGLTTVLFHRLRQPVVLGYIVAGVIIGPYTPPAALITDHESIRTLAGLGVVFLMFSL